MRISDWSSDVCSSDLGQGWVNGFKRRLENHKAEDLYARQIQRQSGLDLAFWNGLDARTHDLGGVGAQVKHHGHQRGRIGRPAHAHRRQGKEKERSEEHTSELQSLMRNSYAVFCLKKKKKNTISYTTKRHTKKKHKKT